MERTSDATVGGVPLAECLAAIRKGSREAFTALYGDSFRALWTIAMMQVRSAALAEDIVQDAFLWLWTHPDVIVPERDIRAYLATAVRTRAWNFHKHQRVEDLVQQSVDTASTDPPALSQPLPPSDAAAEASEFSAAYAEALSTLSERERRAARLRWEEGMTFEEIGQILSLSSMGARNVVLRAQQKVQAGLEKHRGL